MGNMVRAKTSCEKWLLDRIDLANDYERLIASGLGLDDFRKIALREFQKRQAEHDRVMRMIDRESAYRDLLHDFRAAVNEQTSGVCKHLVDLIDLPSVPSGLKLQLMNVKSDAIALRELARLTEKSIRRGSVLSARITGYSWVTLRENGTLKPLSSSVIQRIIVEGIIASRIRSCRGCDQIIWKKIPRSKTCGRDKCIQRAYYLDNEKGRKN